MKTDLCSVLSDNANHFHSNYRVPLGDTLLWYCSGYFIIILLKPTYIEFKSGCKKWRNELGLFALDMSKRTHCERFSDERNTVRGGIGITGRDLG